MKVLKYTPFPKPKNLNKSQKKLWDLREEMNMSNILGDHKRYVNAQRAFMDEFVSHPNDGLTLPPTVRITAPLFSKTGWNMLKVFVGELFRKRTPEDIELAKKFKEIREYNRYWKK